MKASPGAKTLPRVTSMRPCGPSKEACATHSHVPSGLRWKASRKYFIDPPVKQVSGYRTPWSVMV